MKKNAFVVFLLTMLMLTGCQKLVARRDESQVVEFANKMPKGEYTLKIYRLDYPETPSDRDAFYEKFSVLMSKMVAHNKDINLIIPFELYQDIKNIGKRDVRESEKVYYKPASELTEDEKEFIDSKIDISYPENAGIFQEYLNKQVYYWLNYLKRGNEYISGNYYTELDKMKLVEEIFENRKMISKTFEPIENDFILEVNSSNIEEAGKTGLPLYTDGTFEKEDSILINSRKDFLLKDYFCKTFKISLATAAPDAGFCPVTNLPSATAYSPQLSVLLYLAPLLTSSSSVKYGTSLSS